MAAEAVVIDGVSAFIETHGLKGNQLIMTDKSSNNRAAIYIVAMAIYLWLIFAYVILSPVQAADSCLSSVGKAAVAPCRNELLQDPGNVDLRIALSDAFISLKQYQEAVEVLQRGFEFSPGDERLKKKLVLTESYLEEQRWIKKQKEEAASASSSKKQETQLRLSLIRCQKLKGQGALAACNEGLEMAPNHPDLLAARGEVLLGMDTPGSAMTDFKKALAAEPNHRGAAKGLRLADAKRKVLVNRCLKNDGPEALTACDSAMIKGAPDTLDIQKRRAVLLVAQGQKNKAIAAYRAALKINPGDGESKKALAALTPPKELPPVDKTVKKPVTKMANQKKKPISKPSPKKEPSTVKKEGEPPSVQVDKKEVTVEKKQGVKVEPSKTGKIKKGNDNPGVPDKQKPAQLASSSTRKKLVSGDSKPSDLLQEKPKQPVRFSNLLEVEGITH